MLCQIIDEKWYFGLILNLYSFCYKFIGCFNFKDCIFLFLEVLFCSLWNLPGCLYLLFLLIVSNPIFIPSNVLYIVILNSVSNHFIITHHLVLNLCHFGDLSHNHMFPCACGKFQSLCYAWDISVNKTVKGPCSDGRWNINYHRERIRVISQQNI